MKKNRYHAAVYGNSAEELELAALKAAQKVFGHSSLKIKAGYTIYDNYQGTSHLPYGATITVKEATPKSVPAFVGATYEVVVYSFSGGVWEEVFRHQNLRTSVTDALIKTRRWWLDKCMGIR